MSTRTLHRQVLHFLIHDLSVSNVYAAINFHDNKKVMGPKSTLTKKMVSGIPLNTIEYHSVSFRTIRPFNDISIVLSGTFSGNLKYHSIPLNGSMNPKYHQNTIQIPLAIYLQVPLNGI